jgi:hypothetical protein
LKKINKALDKFASLATLCGEKEVNPKDSEGLRKGRKELSLQEIN